MSKKLTFLIMFFLVSTAFSLYAVGATTSKINGTYIIEGTIDATNWYAQGLQSMTDYSNYRLWITKGLDGRDPESAEYWEHLVDFDFHPPQTMMVIFDLNLPWPLGSKGNKAVFHIDENELFAGTLRMHIIEKPAGIEDINLSLYTEDSKTTLGEKSVRFVMDIKFSWLIDALLSPETLGKHMNLVIAKVVSNLQDYSLLKRE